jgi:hypothetical protein
VNRPTACGVHLKPVHVWWHNGLPRGSAHRQGQPVSTMQGRARPPRSGAVTVGEPGPQVLRDRCLELRGCTGSALDVPRMEETHWTGLATSRRRKRFGSAVLRRHWWPLVVPGDRRRTLRVRGREGGGRGLWIGRGGARKVVHRGKGGGRRRRPNFDG